ncbi:hypothetical protein NFI96_007237 [Prochilodus magdalenae]|nr:hypothetical protein NFI96_007237 [Prochilodus magdalenae]
MNFCMDVVVPVKTVRCFANNKPWITSSVKGLLNKKKRAFKDNNQEELMSAQRELKVHLPLAKESYRRKLEQKLRENNMREADSSDNMAPVPPFSHLVSSDLTSSTTKAHTSPLLHTFTADQVRGSDKRRDHSPLHIDGSTVEIVKSTKFLGVHLAEDLTWSLNTSTITKKAQQRKAHPPPILTTFYRGTIESILSSCITAWFRNCTASDRKSLQRVVRTAEKIIGVSLPTITDIYTTRCIHKTTSIVDDHTHPSHTLFTLLPSGKRYRSIRALTSRLCNSFFPRAIRLLNNQSLNFRIGRSLLALAGLMKVSGDFGCFMHIRAYKVPMLI